MNAGARNLRRTLRTTRRKKTLLERFTSTLFDCYLFVVVIVGTFTSIRWVIGLITGR